MNELAQTLQKIIGDRSVEAVAQEWDIKPWRLRDILRGHTKRPRDPADLLAIAHGSGIPYERVVIMAFNGNGAKWITRETGPSPTPAGAPSEALEAPGGPQSDEAVSHYSPAPNKPPPAV
jgi:hypothetical protein